MNALPKKLSLAIGLALAKDGDAIPDLRKRFKTARDSSMKGAYAIALALLGDQDSVSLILEMIEKVIEVG